MGDQEPGTAGVQVKRGWQIFLKIVTFGLRSGALIAKKPIARDILNAGNDALEQVTPDMIEDAVTPPQTPKSKHRGVR